MAEIIKRYSGKLGEITVTRYNEDNRTEYHVKHHGMPQGLGYYWTQSKADAIRCAQFYAGKY